MSTTLALWHADHVNFAKLLNLIEDQLALFQDGASPDYEMLLDIMYYMTRYSDVLHHPKEDLVFALIKERQHGTAERVDELTDQHALLKQFGEELVHDLGDIINGSIVSRASVESAARAYLNSFRRHMDIEEGEILPLAARLLGEADWAVIDVAIRHFEDPLFGTRTEQRYTALRQQIEREAKAAGARPR
jgi:hemerythrin-like domain-containing protein